MPDMVNHPAHYVGDKYEVIDIIEEYTKNLSGVEAVCIGNAIKYILRFQKKNGNEDIQKAIWYLNKYLCVHQDNCIYTNDKKLKLN